MGQFSVAVLNLRQHVIEAFHQRTQFVAAGTRYSNGIIAGLGDGVHGIAQLQNRH